jgi:mRNA-degrading endonuclease toxin of MazEF toxin-antitoxin module
MVITVLTIDCGAVHGVVVHCDDPRVLGSLLRLVGPLQVLLQPSVLLTDQIQTIPDEEVELRVNGNDVSWTNVPATV